MAQHGAQRRTDGYQRGCRATVERREFRGRVEAGEAGCPGRDATGHEAQVALSALEFDLLVALARAPGRAFTRRQLIEKVWGWDFYGDERVVDVHIGRLRKKIENNPDEPALIVTVRGAGYRFEDRPR
jgi:DNA-binding response OmpR family regulator